jgi:hypothetical protein
MSNSTAPSVSFRHINQTRDNRINFNISRHGKKITLIDGEKKEKAFRNPSVLGGNTPICHSERSELVFESASPRFLAEFIPNGKERFLASLGMTK